MIMTKNDIKNQYYFLSYALDSKSNDLYISALSKNNNTIFIFVSENDNDECELYDTINININNNIQNYDELVQPKIIVYDDMLFCVYYSNGILCTTYKPLLTGENKKNTLTAINSIGEKTFNHNNLKFDLITKDGYLYVFYTFTLYYYGQLRYRYSIRSRRFNTILKNWDDGKDVTEYLITKTSDLGDTEYFIFNISINDSNQFVLQYTYTMNDNINNYECIGNTFQDLIINNSKISQEDIDFSKSIPIMDEFWQT